MTGLRASERRRAPRRQRRNRGSSPQALSSTYSSAHLYLAAIAARTGDRATAQWHLDEVRLLWPEFRVSDWLEGDPLADGVQRDALRRDVAAPSP